jgi:alpha/beta superfamily hydrolase
LRSRTNEKIHIEGPAGQLEVVVTDPGENRRGYAIVAHPHPLYGGTLENKVVQTLAKAMFALDLAAVRFNFRGVGESDGVFDEGPGELEDFLSVAAFARSRYGDSAPLLAGFSFGSYIAATAAQQLQSRQLVLIAPAVGRFPLGEVPKQTLVVHGEEDDVVPLADVLEWARPQQLPVTVFPGAGHFFHGALVDLQNLVLRFCRQ